MRASSAWGGSALLQCSHVGRSSSMVCPFSDAQLSLADIFGSWRMLVGQVTWSTIGRSVTRFRKSASSARGRLSFIFLLYCPQERAPGALLRAFVRRLSRRRSPAKQHLHSPPADGMPPPGRRPPYPAEPRDVSRHGRMILSLASRQPREAISTPFLAPDPVVDEKETAGIILPLDRG